MRDRERGGDRPRRADRRDRGAARARHRHERPAGLGQRPPDHALPRAARHGRRDQARQARDRDHPARNRALLRRQGVPPRHPRPGPARREDPAQEDHGGDGAEAADAPPLRQGPGPRPPHDDRDLHDLRPPPRAPHRRHREALLGRARPRRHGALRGGPGDDARPRPRDLSLRHLVEPDRRLRDDRRGRGARRPRRGLGHRQGVRHQGRRGALPHRARRRDGRAASRARRRGRHHDGPARGAPAGSTRWLCATGCA